MPREIENWEAALDALEAIGNGWKQRKRTLPEIAEQIMAIAPRGLNLKTFPWSKYGMERVYIQVRDDRGKLLTKRIFWQAGVLCWHYPPEQRPEWFYALKEAIKKCDVYVWAP